jgi:hypothetical protein
MQEEYEYRKHQLEERRQERLRQIAKDEKEDIGRTAFLRVTGSFTRFLCRY